MARPAFAEFQQPLWAQLREAIGERWDGAKISVDEGPWKLVLDSYREPGDDWSKAYTRLSAPFVNPEGFRFHIYRQGPFAWLGKLLGVQDIEIGDPPFDERWTLQSNAPAKLREFLAEPVFRQLISRLPECEFTLRDDEGEFDRPGEDGARFDELCFSAAGLLATPDELRPFYELFAGSLIKLCALSSAYDA